MASRGRSRHHKAAGSRGQQAEHENNPASERAGWDTLDPHPTDMPILNDAGAARYPPGMIAARLAREQITMTNLLTSEAFDPAS